MVLLIYRLSIYILIAVIVFIPNNSIKLDTQKTNHENLTYSKIETKVEKETKLEENIKGKEGNKKDTITNEAIKLLNTRVVYENFDNIRKEIQEVQIYFKKINEELLNLISFNILDQNNKPVEMNKKNMNKIVFSKPQEYSHIKGITTFRGNPYRDSASFGNIDVRERKLEILWSTDIGSIDKWTGVGWNGQPSIVEWSDELKENMNIKAEKKEKTYLKEVIYGTLDGKVYFLDLGDGKYTREPINISAPIKGSVTVDPRGIPLLYVGQGINKVHGKKVEIGYRIFSLIDQKKLYFINGIDPIAYRGWGAFDSTALIDKYTDTLLICGENGIFYNVKLNTQYDETTGEIKVNPSILKYRYKIDGNRYQGIENSIAVYRNLGYFADNGGWIQCIDINTLEPLWIQNVDDDTDSTIVIEEEKEGEVFLYTANEVDKRGLIGYSNIRKIDALSGNIVWEKSYKCHSRVKPTTSNGGALATPVLGKGDISNMIIYNLARTDSVNRGKLIALDKKTGEEIWTIDMKNYSWSSPVDVYTDYGKGYIIVSNSIGKMYLIEGKSGKILDEINLGSNVEGSPAVFEDVLVVGTRGQKIFGVKIK